MRIVMFFANSDQTHPDQNSGISWARSETSYYGSSDRRSRSPSPLSYPACSNSPLYSAGTAH